MRLNSRLILAILCLSGGLLRAAPVLAQSEMDLLLFEKKNEPAKPEIEVCRPQKTNTKKIRRS